MIWRKLDKWLTTPIPNASKNLGIYRILYGIYFLWFLSLFSFTTISELPEMSFRPVFILRWLNAVPDVSLLNLFESLLAGLFILLIFGYRTKAVTVFILFMNLLLFGLLHSFGKIDHSEFGTIYLPFIMMFSYWGHRYSIDSRLNNNDLLSDKSWLYSWPLRVTLLLLSFLFFSSGFVKSMRGGWLFNPENLANIIRSASIGKDSTLMASIILSTPLIYVPLQYVALIFELTFPLSLLNRYLQVLYIGTAIIFHTSNRIMLGIFSYSFFMIYMLFIDWSYVIDFLSKYVQKPLWINRISSKIWIVFVICFSILIGFFWNHPVYSSRALFRAEWFIPHLFALLIVVISIVVLSVEILHSLQDRRKSSLSVSE